MSQSIATAQPGDEAARALNTLTEQSRHLVDASVRTAAAEAASFLQQRWEDDAKAIRALARCRTPLDLLAVQQTWLSARAEAWMDAASHMVLGALLEPQAAAAETAAFRLPD